MARTKTAVDHVKGHLDSRWAKLSDGRYWMGIAVIAFGLLVGNVGAGPFWLTTLLYSFVWLTMPTEEDIQRRTLRSLVRKMALSATTEEEMLRVERLRQFTES